MTLLEKIDAVFTWLYLNSGKDPNLPDIMAGLNNPDIDEGEVKDILAKLRRDNLIYCVMGQDRNAEYSDYGKYLITFDGKYFYETVGGFVKQHQIEQLNLKNLETDVNIRKTNERLIAGGTKWLAIGTFSLVLVEILIHWKELVHLFSCQ